MAYYSCALGAATDESIVGLMELRQPAALNILYMAYEGASATLLVSAVTGIDRKGRDGGMANQACWEAWLPSRSSLYF